MSESIDRFAPVERLVHRSVALLMGVCLVTAAILYNGSLMMAVGHRHLVETVHVWSGLALPVPMLAGALSAAYRSDVRRLNRFTPDDWRWLRSRSRRDGTIPVGKFNAGQKVNAWLVAGATFVHDWSALALGLLVLGHIAYAVRDPEARRGMRTGRVSARWARAEHGEWAAEMDDPSRP